MSERFGRYELVRPIGTGGMAEVFKAQTFGPEGFVKDVVIKRILPAFNEDPDFVRMFINEARLAARLQHANIVQIFDFNQVEGVYFIAMEWVDGTDLRRIMNASRRRSMPLPVRAAIHVAVEALKGLHYAGNRAEGGRPLNIVHRDISPHNLLVSRSGEVKVTDFGIAKVAALASATRTGMLKGKLTYMSPEQASGLPLDARSDIFALGIVLWEMLTGRRLYRGDSEPELFAQVKRAEVPPPGEIRTELPQGLESVVLKMLAAERDARHADPAEALEDLSRFASGGDGLAVAAFVRELLPDELTQDNRGQTEPLAVDLTLPPETAVEVAGPGAPTRTRPPDREDSDARQPDEAGESSVGTGPMIPTQPQASRKSRTGGLVALAAWVLLCGLVGWWAAGRLGHHHDVPHDPMTALVVETVPEGAEVRVDKVPLGAAPLTVSGVPGSTIAVSAHRGQQGVSATQVLGAAESVRLNLKPANPPSTPTLSTPATSRPANVEPVRPTSVPEPRVPRPASKGWGRLVISVSPWARVKIDGQKSGTTPVGKRLRAGPHRLELLNPELDRRVTLKVEIKAGKTTRVKRSWD